MSRGLMRTTARCSRRRIAPSIRSPPRHERHQVRVQFAVAVAHSGHTQLPGAPHATRPQSNPGRGLDHGMRPHIHPPLLAFRHQTTIKPPSYARFAWPDFFARPKGRYPARPPKPPRRGRGLRRPARPVGGAASSPDRRFGALGSLRSSGHRTSGFRRAIGRHTVFRVFADANIAGVMGENRSKYSHSWWSTSWPRSRNNRPHG